MNYLRSVANYLSPQTSPLQETPADRSDTWEVIGEEEEASNKERKESLDQVEIVGLGREHTKYYMIENEFFNDVMVEKDENLRVLDLKDWRAMIKNKNLEGFCRKNILFSIMKGIPKEVRNDFWEILADTGKMRKSFKVDYLELIKDRTCKNFNIIEKDVPRTKVAEKYRTELTNILMAYSNLDPQGYTQGMNLICGSLLNILSLDSENQQGEEPNPDEIGFEERVFWVFVSIMYGKNWRQCFQEMRGLQRMLKQLEELMEKHTPEIIWHIRQKQLDLNMCFAQYYLTLVIYNTPLELATIILDLFLLEGERVIHSVILKMLIACRQKILETQEMGDLVRFFKSGMLEYCHKETKRQCEEASSLEGFILNFFTLSSQ